MIFSWTLAATVFASSAVPDSVAFRALYIAWAILLRSKSCSVPSRLVIVVIEIVLISSYFCLVDNLSCREKGRTHQNSRSCRGLKAVRHNPPRVTWREPNVAPTEG